LLHTMG